MTAVDTRKVRRGPYSVKTRIVNGRVIEVKKCNGPTCHGEFHPVSDFSEINAPSATARVSAETLASPSPFKYYSSQCRRCHNSRHMPASGGPSGLVSIHKVTPLVDELMTRCGNSTKEVSRLSGIDRTHINMLRREKQRHVRKATAQKIFQGLLLARRPSYKPPQGSVYGRGTLPSERQLRLKDAERELRREYGVALSA